MSNSPRKFLTSKFLTAAFLLFFIPLNFANLSAPNFAFAANVNCYERPAGGGGGGTTDAKTGDPTFVQISRRSSASINYEKPKLELSGNSSNQVIISYEKSLITTSPEVRVTSVPPAWLTISGNTNAVDLRDDTLGFVEMTFVVADGISPNSTAEIELKLVDVGSQEINATKTLKITVDRNLFAQISIPVQGSLVRGNVPIFGLAYGNNFSFYAVEYGAGYEPAVWTTVTSSTAPQTNDASPIEFTEGNLTIYGNIATWETGLTEYSYPYYPWSIDLNGIYTVRLKVANTTGEFVSDEVTVQVGQVIGSTYSGTAIDPTGNALLIVSEQSIKDDFEVIGIDAINSATVPVESGYRLVGSVYELQPPGLEFTKDATLEFYYTDTDLGSSDETKLGIYTYNPTTGHWDYISSAIDAVNNKVSGIIRKITSGYAYYAILEKTSIPGKPVLSHLASPIQNKLIAVSGTSDRNITIEIFVNGASKATGTSTNAGIFDIQNVILNAGINTITAKAKDQYNQVSPESNPVTVEVVEPQITVNSLKFKTSDYSVDFTDTVDLDSILYLQLNGSDSDPAVQDKTSVYLTSSLTDPEGIEIQLTETDISSGIYRGSAKVGINSSRAASTIAAYQDSEVITAKSKMYPVKTDTVTFADDTSPQVPTITSSTHPSVCQDAFEDGFDQWSNRDGEVGATLYLNKAQTIDGTKCLELVNEEYGGNFASNIRTTQFDVSQYPLVNLDYKIKDNVKINFLVKLKDDPIWYDIIFTDDAKNYWRMNMEPISTIAGVLRDDSWHHASFNLYDMLKTKTNNFQVDSIIMADWDTTGYMKLVYGTNPAYASYYIDNFTITSYGSTNNSPQFTITIPGDPSGIAGYSYVLDQTQDTIPDETIDGTDNVVNYTDVADGAWYFHVIAKDGAGNWSKANHYKIVIDTKGPIADSFNPHAYSSSGSPVVILHLTDNQGTGVDPETIRLKVEGNEYDIHSPALTYDKQSETLTFTPLKLGIIWPDGQVVDVELIQATDRMGNTLQNSLNWEWTLDYSLDTTPPDAPRIISPAARSLTYNKVTFVWQAEDANGISDYSFILDQNPATIPDDAGEGLVSSKIYDLTSGAYYFHVKAKDGNGNWSQTTHYQVNVGQNTSLLINDFNDGQDPSEVGGWSGSWDSGTATCQASYYSTDLSNVYGQTGYSLQFNYDVTAVNSYSGYWTATYIDLSNYKFLTFWIKGAVGGERLKVGLKDAFWNESKILIDDYLSSGITTSWQKVTMPLSAFKNVTAWTSMDNISISFDNNLGTPLSGAVYIDEVRFEKAAEPIIISTFNGASAQNALGGNFEAFAGGVATISAGYDSNNAYNNSSYGYNITYGGIDYCNYAIWKTSLNNLDASGCNSLSFYVKGSVGGEKPNIWLGYTKEDSTYDGKFVDIERYAAITTDWKRINVPLLDFINQGVDIAKLMEMQVVFEWENMSGTIYIDDIQFTNVDFGEAPIVDPIAGITNQENITITGRGTPGQKIIPVVEIPYIGRWQQTPVIVNPDGTFTAVVNIYSQGHKQIYVYAIDENGNITLVSAVQTTLLDQTAPPVPVVDSIVSPTQNSSITVSGSAESGTDIHIRITQPDSQSVEYTQEAAYGAYSRDITLSGGDGVYRITVASKDDAGNRSAESTPIQVVLDAVNEKPVVSVTSPNGGEILSQNAFNILWQAADPDPTDTLKIDIQYTNSLNQVLVDNFDDGDWLNSLKAWSGPWDGGGAAIEVLFNSDFNVAYGNTGKTLQLNYNVTTQNSYAGIWTGLYTKPDMSAYEYISFLVKGAAGGEVFEVGLKDSTWTETKLPVASYLPNGVAANWQRLVIPLGDFVNINLSSMDNFSIGFANSIGSGQGTVYVDEIRFIKWQDVVLNQTNSGSYDWNAAALLASDKYLLKLTAKDTEGLDAKDESDDYFCLASNLAKDKVASSSSEEGPDVAPSKAIDGITDTRWSSQFSDPQWIEIDLGQKQNINRVILRWETAYGKSYEIQVSDNGINWTTVYSTTTGDGSIDDISFANTQCRYVRMYGAGRGTECGYSLWEFEVYHTTTPFYSAVASSEQGPDVSPIYAIDGNSSTRWSSNFTDNEWIYADLGASKTFDSVILNWETAYGRKYEIQISDDAQNWTTVYTENGSDGGIDTLNVGERTARYLKMKGIQRGTEWGYSLWEIEARYE